MQKLIEKARKFAIKEYTNYNGKFGSEFMIALTGECVKLAEELADESMDKTALIIGTYLHDIGRTITDGPEHAAEGAKIAKDFLKKNNADEQTKTIVLDCILNHGSSAEPKTAEGKLLQFIDKAALINIGILQIYIKKLAETMTEEEAMQKAMESLDKWYNRLGDRKAKVKKEYKACKEYLLHHHQQHHKPNTKQKSD